jgi:hypothetical protein
LLLHVKLLQLRQQRHQRVGELRLLLQLRCKQTGEARHVGAAAACCMPGQGCRPVVQLRGDHVCQWVHQERQVPHTGLLMDARLHLLARCLDDSRRCRSSSGGCGCCYCLHRLQV